MKPEYQKYQLIDRYLNNRLTAEELHAFEQELKNDPEFHSAVELQRLTNDTILEKRFFDVIEEIESNSDDKNNWWRSKGFLFSCIALITSVMIVGIFNYTRENRVIVNSAEVKYSETLTEIKPSNVEKIPGSGNKEVLLKATEVISTPETKDTSKIKDNFPLILVEDKKQEKEFFQENTSNEIIDKCATIKIKGEISTTASCKDKASGSIIINGISGGKSPYRFAIKGIENLQNNNTFNNLSAGSYEIIAIDAEGCNAAIGEAIVNSISCIKKENFSFNPSAGELWKFPGGNDANANLKVLNKNGIEIYNTKIINGSPSAWDGTTASGNEAESGSYIYVLEFSNGEMVQGMLSIIR